MSDRTHQAADEIAKAITRLLKADAQKAAGYSKVKAAAIARYALLIGEAYAAGELNEEEMRDEIEELDRMAERFVRNIRALAHMTVELPFDAVGQALRGVIGASVAAQGVTPPQIAPPRA